MARRYRSLSVAARSHLRATGAESPQRDFMSETLDIACEIARSAGALLMPYFKERVRVEYKGEMDLVTEADRVSEAFIVGQLREKFPTHGVVAEEGSGYAGESGYTWYIDPLDGTTNFSHSFPVFAVSMGLEKQGSDGPGGSDSEMVIGVVYDPTRDELFAAEKGGGATLNGSRIRVSTIG